jgi:polar amino acid transport system substrate-binding protein
MSIAAFVRATSIIVSTICLPVIASAGPVMDKIRETGKVTVATEASYPPFEFMQDGKIVGYGKDLLTEVIAALSRKVGRDVTLEQLDLPFQGILPGLSAGQFDFVATSVGINAERAKRYAYTRPMAISVQTVMIRAADVNILKTPQDLNGKVLGTQMASASEPVARGFDAKMKAEGKPGFSELKLLTSYPETYVALANGSIDAVLQSGPALAVLVKARPGVFHLMGPLTDQKSFLAWVTRPADEDLRQLINAVFSDLNKGGKMGELQEKWFGFKMETPDQGYLPEGAL